MSEYQYYEFRAIDRPLDRQQMAALRALSTRAEITPTSFSNFYTFGNFKGNPEELVRRYFDAFVYVSNWGTREFMLRIPRNLIDADVIDEYCNGESLLLIQTDEHLIIQFSLNEEPFDEWSEGEEWVPLLLPIRDDLIRGDFRALYLGWLALSGEEWGDADEDWEEDEFEEGDDPGGASDRTEWREPPVPPGLQDLTEPLKELASFLQIDPDLLEAAASLSPPSRDEPADARPIAPWLAKLPTSAKDAYLLRLLEGESDVRIRAELLKRHREETAPPGRPIARKTDRRTYKELRQAGSRLKAARLLRQREQAAQETARRQRAEAEAHARYLHDLAAREADAWDEAETLIDQKRAGPYEQAVELLANLLDVAERAGRREAAEERLAELRERHAGKPALIRRFDAKGLGL